MASKYEITPLNSNKTILMIVKDIEKHLHDNPLYKVYFADASYTSGTLIYDVDDLSIPDGDELTTGDIVVFNNSYYAEIDAVGTETYTIKNVVLFKGAKGDKGDKGDTGATGNGIVSIEKTSTSGNVDTYTITYTNGDTDTFTITNAPQTIGADNIDSGEATNGQVLTANGSGGASWGTLLSGVTMDTLWTGSSTSVNIPDFDNVKTIYKFLIVKASITGYILNDNDICILAPVGYALASVCPVGVDASNNTIKEMGSVRLASTGALTIYKKSITFKSDGTITWNDTPSISITAVYGVK